jgi:lactate racemase
MSNGIKLPQLFWHGPRELDLPLPENWHLDVRNFAGYNRPALTDSQIKETITHPIGTPRIRELAKGKKEVVIIFDDIHRPTRAYRMVPPILEELAEAGIPDGSIRFMAANGTHGTMNREDFVKKLGPDIPGRFRCYNHNPFDACTYVGTTSRGNKIFLNSEFVQCDFKISIGSITPHLFAVFSGGGKMILPGVASRETIVYNHTLPCAAEDKPHYDRNPVPLDMSEAASFAHLDFNIEGLLNGWGDTCALFAGDLNLSHDAGVQEAKTHYFTERTRNKDIVIYNVYTKITEAASGVGAMYSSLNKEGGDLVIICNSPAGQVVHYLVGPWGNLVSAKMRMQIPIPPHVNRIIVYNEYPDLAGLGYIENSPKVIAVNKWEDVLKILQKDHGDKAEVGVYPNGDIQLWPRE